MYQEALKTRLQNHSLCHTLQLLTVLPLHWNFLVHQSNLTQEQLKQELSAANTSICRDQSEKPKRKYGTLLQSYNTVSRYIMWHILKKNPWLRLLASCHRVFANWVRSFGLDYLSLSPAYMTSHMSYRFLCRRNQWTLYSNDPNAWWWSWPSIPNSLYSKLVTCPINFSVALGDC